MDMSHGPANAASARSVDDSGDELAVDTGGEGLSVLLEVEGDDGLAVAASELVELGVACAVLEALDETGDWMGA